MAMRMPPCRMRMGMPHGMRRFTRQPSRVWGPEGSRTTWARRWGVALTHIGTIREGDTHDKDTRQISRYICTERELKSDDRKQLKLPGTAGPLPSCAAE